MKNIVWLVSYPKSGNTWFRMFLANYLQNTQLPLSLDEIERTPIASDSIGFEEETGLNPFELLPDEVDLFRPDFYRSISKIGLAQGDIFYKKTHDAYTKNKNGDPIFPEDVSKGVVYFVRNPLDVVVSFANHSALEVSKKVDFILNNRAELAGKKSGQLRQILLTWEDHYKSWTGQILIPMHVVRYEDMQRKPMETFGSIVRFLNLEYDEERLSRSIINSDFKLLQQMEQEKGFKEKFQECKNFFWKGIIGNYQNHLSEEQVQQIISHSSETMRQLGYIDSNGTLTV